MSKTPKFFTQKWYPWNIIILILFILLIGLLIWGGMTNWKVIYKKDEYANTNNHSRTEPWTIIFDDGPWTTDENPINKYSQIEDRSVQYHLSIAQSIRRVPKNSKNRYIMALNGIYAKKYARDIVELDKAGVIIANHSYNHRSYKEMSLEECIEDWYATQRALGSVLGYTPKIFQYPFLARNDAFTAFLKRQNIEILHPDHCLNDYDSTPVEVLRNFKSLVQPNNAATLGQEEDQNGRGITMHSCKATAGCIKNILRVLENSLSIPYGGTMKGIRDCTLWASFEDRIYLHQYCMQNDIPCGPIIFTNLHRYLITPLKDIITRLSTGSFVVKMNHLSGSRGVLIVVNGVITKHFTPLTSLMGEYENNTVSESTIDNIVKDVEQLWDVKWRDTEPNGDCGGEQNVRPGVVIENLIDDGLEIKIHCWYGEPFYVHIVHSSASPFQYKVIKTCSVKQMLESPELPRWLSEKALPLASLFSRHTGMDYVRVDIRIIGEKCVITEVTRCGDDIDEVGREMLNERIKS